MQNILVYGDSLSWGIIPDSRQRLPFDERWPGIVERNLNRSGQHVRVIEDCLNGRRTVWEDPFKPGRNGLQGVGQTIEKHSPLDLVVLMLGTNDFQFSHTFNRAWSVALGIAALVNAIRAAPLEPGMPVPPVLIVAPPAPDQPKGIFGPKFEGAGKRAHGLGDAYRTTASELRCGFFDAGEVVCVSPKDGVHLDRGDHLKLGNALTAVIAGILV